VGTLALEIGFVCPPLAERADRVARRISDWLAGAAPVERVLHGDFSDTQVLIDGSDVAIVDLDSARCGDPADDLGALFAQIESYALRGKITGARAVAIGEAILDGYRRGPDPSPAERIAPYMAAGLLRRARFAFRSRRPNWQDITDSSLARAEAALVGLRRMDPA
jgi:aminoglycoside phosphotransferase (APT) family kinase protein